MYIYIYICIYVFIRKLLHALCLFCAFSDFSTNKAIFLFLIIVGSKCGAIDNKNCPTVNNFVRWIRSIDRTMAD